MQTMHIDHGHVLLAAEAGAAVVASELADRLDLDVDDVRLLIDDLVAAGIIDRDRLRLHG